MSLDYYRDWDKFYNLYYVDEDPELAAQAVADQHLCKSIVWAAQVLSMAWYTLSLPARGDIDAVLTLDWSKDGQEPYGQLKWSNARLFDTRIYFTGHNSHPHIEWASTYGGNYQWLYRFASCCLEQLRANLGRIHSATPCLRVLETLPPQLIDTAHQWCDAPALLPAEYQKETSVESYRAYYRSMRAALQYTGRARPEWL